MKKKCILFSLTLFILFTNLIAAFALTEETLIILDQSASMYEHFERGIKFSYAKEVVLELLKGFENTEYIGLRTVSINPQVMRMRAPVTIKTLCTATKLVNPIQFYNKGNIENSVNEIIPNGMSPIQYTLMEAINNDFTLNSDLKHIILVTDGWENCNGDPCSYIRKIMMTRNDIKIDIIAIGVPPDAAEKLQCLTKNTKGKFVDIKNPNDITPKIKTFLDPQFIPTEPDYPDTTKTPQERNDGIIYKNYLLEFFE